jgi:hypothetical protein
MLAGGCKKLRDGMQAKRFEWLAGQSKELRDGWLLAISYKGYAYKC